MIALRFGTHLFLTIRTGFIQRKFFTEIRLSITQDPDSQGDISQFAALTTALASTIGTGNIIGVGTATALGGAGAGSKEPVHSSQDRFLNLFSPLHLLY